MLFDHRSPPLQLIVHRRCEGSDFHTRHSETLSPRKGRAKRSIKSENRKTSFCFVAYELKIDRSPPPCLGVNDPNTLTTEAEPFSSILQLPSHSDSLLNTYSCGHRGGLLCWALLFHYCLSQTHSSPPCSQVHRQVLKQVVQLRNQSRTPRFPMSMYRWLGLGQANQERS